MTTLLNPGSASSLRMLPPLRANQVIVRDERVADLAARERLLDTAFGPARFAKTCQRLRDGNGPALGLSLVASDGASLVGTLRFWDIRAGHRPALLLGPLAVSAAHRCEGIGGRLIRAGLDRARSLGHTAVLLVGNAPYYARFGFERRFTTDLFMPGPVDGDRFLGLELMPGSLAQVGGPVTATAAPASHVLSGLRQAA